jgi:hypothetical protein
MEGAPLRPASESHERQPPFFSRILSFQSYSSGLGPALTALSPVPTFLAIAAVQAVLSAGLTVLAVLSESLSVLAIHDHFAPDSGLDEKPPLRDRVARITQASLDAHLLPGKAKNEV